MSHESKFARRGAGRTVDTRPDAEVQAAEQAAAARQQARQERQAAALAAITPEWLPAVDFLVGACDRTEADARMTVGLAILDGCPDPDAFMDQF